MIHETPDEHLTAPNINNLVHDMVEKAKEIHCSCLFTSEGTKFKQKLCILLSGTKPSNLYAGWEDVGVHLGIDPSLIKCIKYNFQYEDPTSNLLLAYSQKHQATVGKIIETIYQLKRYDIVLQLKDEFDYMIREIKTQRTSITYSKLPLECPFIFKDLNQVSKKFERHMEMRKIRFETDQRCLSAPQAKNNTKINRYKKTVLLTFSKSAEAIIEEVALKLRREKNGERIGVVILEEQIHKLNLNPEEFIFNCFSQVDYVIPIITEDYVKAITLNGNNEESGCKEDCKYVKYIYTLMNVNYLKSGCKNYKVRSVIPNEAFESVKKKAIMRHPLFQVWFKIDDMNQLYESIICGKL